MTNEDIDRTFLLADILELHAKRQALLNNQGAKTDDHDVKSLERFMNVIIEKITSDPDTCRYHHKAKDKKTIGFYPHLLGVYKDYISAKRQ